MAGWWRKALREAKLNSSWAAPDEDYEGACEAFLAAALDGGRSAAFLADLTGFVDEIAPAGALNGLVQALLRCASPGMPDLYQGCEGWDLSLVDPDNRRPVDYRARQAWLAEETPFEALLGSWRDGRVKQRLIATVLDLRRRWPELFAEGDYAPLALEGEAAGRVIAFLRRNGAATVLVAAPLCLGEAVSADDLALRDEATMRTRLEPLPELVGRRARNALTGEDITLEGGTTVGQLFKKVPLVCATVS